MSIFFGALFGTLKLLFGTLFAIMGAGFAVALFLKVLVLLAAGLLFPRRGE